jgi:ATP-dependent Clp protease ATP-binding subunit ClpX
MIPEFVGRFPVVVSTSGLTMEQMVHVMTMPKNALIKQYRYQFALHNVEFHVTDEALREVATIALKKNTGAHLLLSHQHAALGGTTPTPPAKAVGRASLVSPILMTFPCRCSVALQARAGCGPSSRRC